MLLPGLSLRTVGVVIFIQGSGSSQLLGAVGLGDATVGDAGVRDGGQ